MTTKINGTNTAASPAITGTDTDTGLSFASDTVNINTGGTTRATIDSAGALDVPTNFPIKVNGSEKLRIDSTGKVGLNVSSPTELLTIGGCAEFKAYDDTNGQSGFHSTGFIIGNAYSAGKGSSVSDDRNIIIWNERGLDIEFGTSDTKRMRIMHSGQVHVGPHATPFTTTTLLNIQRTNGSLFSLYHDGTDNNAASIIKHQRASGSDMGTMIQFNNSSGSAVGTIQSGASGTAYNTSSDYRLKENVTAISDGITRLKTLKPSRFNFKINKDITVDGFLAHEVTAVPEAISGTKDGMKAETYYREGDTLPSGKVVGDVKTYSSTEPEYQGIDQSKLVPLLTAALQEAIAKIETLETKVAALEAA